MTAAAARRRAIIESPAGAEERVDHHAGEDDDERDHQPDTNPVPTNVPGHEPIYIDGPAVWPATTEQR
jgi:hypothetical protein